MTNCYVRTYKNMSVRNIGLSSLYSFITINPNTDYGEYMFFCPVRNIWKKRFCRGKTESWWYAYSQNKTIRSILDLEEIYGKPPFSGHLPTTATIDWYQMVAAIRGSTVYLYTFSANIAQNLDVICNFYWKCQSKLISVGLESKVTAKM